VIDEKLLFALCFVAFVLIAYKPVKRAILGLIDREILRINNELNKVTALKNEAETMVQSLEKQLRQITEERKLSLIKAKEHAEQIKTQNMHELDLMIARKEQDAINQLECVKDAAIQKIRQDFLAQTQLLSTKYVKDNTSSFGSDYEIASRLIQNVSAK